MFPGPSGSPLAKPTRHNPDILSFGGIQSPRKERPVIKRFRPDVSPCQPAPEETSPWAGKGTKTNGLW
jgi:hypothetical protein